MNQFSGGYFRSRLNIVEQDFRKLFLIAAFAFMAAFSTVSHSATQEPARPSDTTISLTRSVCYRLCPNYTVEIHGDGRVRFSTEEKSVGDASVAPHDFPGSGGVLVPGTHEDSIPPQAVAELLEQFRRVGFWRLKNRYAAKAFDGSSQIITLDIGERHKRVVDYLGTEVGMPQSVRNLEDAIDHVAGTARWVDGNAALIPWLERQHFDFYSLQASELAVAGEQRRADEAMVLALLDHGAHLDVSVSVGPMPPGAVATPEPAGILLIQATIPRGHARVFQRLAADGWLARWGKAKAAEAFAEQAAGCSPELVDAVADAGIDVDATEHPAGEDNGQVAQGKTALSELGTAYTCVTNEDARMQTARRLLARGANPNHRDSEGHTPLYAMENLDLLNVLLANGADATIKSNKGESVVFGSWTDAIVLRLLQAGASPVGHYDDGRTLVQQAVFRKMPQVAKWLVDHPEAYQQ